MKLGTLTRAGSRWRLRYERPLSHPVETVFRALTDPDHLAIWFPTSVAGEWTAGAKLTFTHVGQDLPPMDGVVLAYQPPTLLEFTWGGDTLRFELAPAEGGCVLTLLVDFDEQGKAARDGAGWHECLDVLAAMLAGEQTWRPGEHWQELTPGYVEAFGPAGSSVGPPEGWQDPTGTG